MIRNNLFIIQEVTACPDVLTAHSRASVFPLSDDRALIIRVLFRVSLNRCFDRCWCQCSLGLKSNLEVPTVMKMAVFLVVAPCRLVSFYQSFRGVYCLHYHGDACPDRKGDGGTTGL
jgi:hypothetical protein